jgi:hypothetical protein
MDYVVEAIRTAERRGLDALEIRPEAFRAFNQRLQEALRPSVYNNGGCSSFYLDEHGTNFVTWPWSFGRLRRALSTFDIENYETVPRTGTGVA